MLDLDLQSTGKHDSASRSSHLPLPSRHLRASQSYYTAGELTELFNVSTRTVGRWRKQGLAGKRMVVDGRRRIVFAGSEVERFVLQNTDRVRRASRFRLVTDEERTEIVDRARRLARAGQSRGEIVQRVAEAMQRSVTTIRSVVNQRRAEMIFELPLDCVYSREFDKRGADKVILAPAPAPARKPSKPRPPKGLPPYLASLYETPLLTREQEQHLFRKYNYLKYKAGKSRDKLDSRSPSSHRIRAIQRLYDKAVNVRNQLIRANLRLVVSLAKQRIQDPGELFERISDGNLSLFRAVEKFDYSRGFKFSTYATWAIVKNYARTMPENLKQLTRFSTGHDEMIDAARDERGDHTVQLRDHERQRRHVNRILAQLDGREQDIIVRRFGLDYRHEPQTLQQVGDELGVSKERIRQLQTRALKKLREAASREGVQLAELN